MPGPAESESDSDVEFEDVPLPSRSRGGNNIETSSAHSVSIQTERQPWSPSLYLPQQRSEPIRSGSEEETQLRGRLSAGIERISYRQMKSQIGMDEPGTRASERRFKSFEELAAEVGVLVDTLWASATPSIQVESLITLAGITEMALPTYTFEPEPTLNILHKFDVVFAALCTGQNPITNQPLPGVTPDRPLVTQTQKVRIRSLAETTRNRIFTCLSDSGSAQGMNGNGRDLDEASDEGEDEDSDLDAEISMHPWMLEATKVYDKTLMLLADQGDGVEVDGACYAE